MDNTNITNIYKTLNFKRKRLSSYDRKGGNDDRFYVQPHETMVFGQIDKPGIVRHIWITINNIMENEWEIEKNALRKVVLRIYWDDQKDPAVEAPLGDFFGMGHAQCHNFVSVPLQMSPENGRGFNSWWPMPFKKARFEVTNDCNNVLVLYFYIDYEEREIDEEMRFHARWRRTCPTKGISEENRHKDNIFYCHGGENLDGKDNFLILHTNGKGHYCGCNLNIHNLSNSEEWDWVGEGDDMIFIDGDPLPTLNGTGTEDYFNTSWCPTQEYNAPYHGVILPGKENWKGKITYYRYHILDPIPFEKEILVSIEHGHANHRSDDFSVTAYWYQSGEATYREEMLPVKERMPVDEEILRKEHRIVKEDITLNK